MRSPAGVALAIGLSGMSSLAFSQDQTKHRVVKGWMSSEPRKSQEGFEAFERQFADRVFDPRADDLLKASQAFTRLVFAFPDLAFRRAVTYQSASGDILLAEWSVDGPSAKGTLILEDTPDANLYRLRLNRREIVSREDITAFLSDVLIRDKPPIDVAPGSHIFYLPAPPPGVIAFSAEVGRSQFDGILNVYIAGAMTDQCWYLTVRITKGFTRSYYPVPPFIPERFPPLTELLRDWSFERIWSEVERTNPEHKFVDHRDALLIKELARRGLSADQFADLLLSARPGNFYERARATLQAMTDANKPPDALYLKTVLDRYERIGPAPDSAVELLFGRLTKNCSPELDALALKTLNNRLFPTGPLAYLGRCASSSEMLHAIEQVSVPDRSIHSKNSALEEIRKRLGNSLQ